MKVIVVGAGGHGQVTADILLKHAASGGSLIAIGFVDDEERIWRTNILGLSVFGPIDMLDSIAHDAVVVAIGANRLRFELIKRLLSRGEQLVAAIHPSAQIAYNTAVQPGAMICAGVVVNTGSCVGEGVIVNTGATVDHHTNLASCAHIAPGVHMGGNVHVGERTLVGVGATVLPTIRIGHDAVIGAGATVTRDVPDEVTVVGTPARVMTSV